MEERSVGVGKGGGGGGSAEDFSTKTAVSNKAWKQDGENISKTK